MDAIKRIVGWYNIRNGKIMMEESLRLLQTISNYDIRFLRLAGVKIKISPSEIVAYDKCIVKLNKLYIKQGIVELKPCYNDSITKLSCDRLISWDNNRELTR